jgi:fatty acid desaturase
MARTLELTPEVIRQLHVPRPGRFALLLTLDWLVIASCVALWLHWPTWWLLPPLWVIVGSRQHAIAVLMHETIHQRLSKRWPISQLAGYACAWSLLISWNSFKWNHLQHHKHLNTEADPDLTFKLKTAPADWQYPKTALQLAVLLTKDLFGYGLIAAFRRLRRYRGTPATVDGAKGSDPLLLRLIFTASFVSLWMLAAGWQAFVLLWLVPLFTTLPFMLRFRSISEHFHLSDEMPEKTRIVRASWFERELLGFGPHLIGYHVPHHRYPGVPCHNLKQLDRLLAGDDDRMNAHESLDGYLIGGRTLVRQLRSPV